MSKIVERTLDLLELFAEERRPLSLSDIARLLRIPVSSCHDVLGTMQARGYLYEIAPRAGYYPTQRLHLLGRVISEHDPVLARADVVLRALRDKLDESVLLAKVNGLQAVYLLVFGATHPLRFMVNVGETARGLTTTSAGKALLGGLDPAERAAAIQAATLKPQTARTITSKAALCQEIERGQARGWHLNQGESLEGVTTLSVRFSWNAAAYIVTVAGPSTRLDTRLDDVAAELMAACRALEMRKAASGR